MTQIDKSEATPSAIMVFLKAPAKVAGGNVNNTGTYTVNELTPEGSAKAVVIGSVEYADPFSAITIHPKTQLTYGRRIAVQLNGLVMKDGTTSNDSAVSTVNGTGSTINATKTAEQAVAYPILTEQVSFPAGGGASSGSPQSRGSLSARATAAISDVLGWKVNATDTKGFVGALTHSFALEDVDGHTEATWKPRSYAVQTDLSGGITGAQASLYTLAKTALNQSLPLLEGLYPLNPEADQEDILALRELAKSQLTEIVAELGTVGGPSVLRVETYFKILLGTSTEPVPPDADSLTEGTLKEVRDTYGIHFLNNAFSNSIADEQDITNFRVITDYVTSLLRTWINNRQFFELGIKGQPAFLGTQLVLISRQLSVIVETVNELRFALDSVFIGPSERQTLLLEFADARTFPAMFLEDLLREIEDFCTDEGPQLVQSGGRLSISNNVVPVVRSYRDLVKEAKHPVNLDKLPDGFKTVRVKHAIDDLHDQLAELFRLAKPVGRNVAPPEEEGELEISPPSAEFGVIGAYGRSVPLTAVNFTPSDIALSMSMTGQRGRSLTLGTLAAQSKALVSLTLSGTAQSGYTLNVKAIQNNTTLGQGTVDVPDSAIDAEGNVQAFLVFTGKTNGGKQVINVPITAEAPLPSTAGVHS